jgi:hypothetical protein
VGENVFGISAAAEEDEEEESDSKAAGKLSSPSPSSLYNLWMLCVL